MTMQQSTDTAGERVDAGTLCVVRPDGKLYRYRGALDETVVGVAAFDAEIGDLVLVLTDISAISEAMMADLSTHA